MVDLNECLLPAGYFRNVGIAADGDFAGMTASDFYNNNDTGAPMTNTAGDELCDNPHIDGQEGECVDSSQPWIEIPIYSQGSYTMETTNVSIDAHGCLCAPGSWCAACGCCRAPGPTKDKWELCSSARVAARRIRRRAAFHLGAAWSRTSSPLLDRQACQAQVTRQGSSPRASTR